MQPIINVMGYSTEIGPTDYIDSMDKSSFDKADSEKAYKIDRGLRNVKAGAAIGMLVGALVFMLLGRWLPEHFFVPTILIVGAIFAVALGIFWPTELAYHQFDDDPDNITPAERVERLDSEVSARTKSDR